MSNVSYARLKHDVAKYVIRTAQNLPSGVEVPASLTPLLLRDAYGDPGDLTLERYRRDAAALTPDARRQCDEAFEALGGLEAAARKAETGALKELVALLRGIAQAIDEGEA